MPKQYEEIKASYLRRGKSLKEAKKLAAMTYNSRHPAHPMHAHRKKKQKSKNVGDQHSGRFY